MPGFRHTFTMNRVTQPDPGSLYSGLAALDSTVGIYQQDPITWIFKKATDWLPAHITAAQSVLDTCAAVSPQTIAQTQIDRFDIATRALVLVLIDEINILRTVAGLAPRTPAQAIAAIRTKAATL